MKFDEIGGESMSETKELLTEQEIIESDKLSIVPNEFVRKADSLYLQLIEMIRNEHETDGLIRIGKYLNWLEEKTKKVNEEDSFDSASIPELKRRNVILVDLGFNVGDEFGGEHWAIVLKKSSQKSKRVLILPITSKEPTNRFNPIYVEIGKINGLSRNKHHWANIFNICSISKQRIKYPPEPMWIDSRIMNRLSGAIKSQIV